MRVVNNGGTIVYGDKDGNTVFFRNGTTADVSDELYKKHKDRFKKVSDDESEALEEQGRIPEVQTTAQRRASTRKVRTSKE
jgi:hypothetical protein